MTLRAISPREASIFAALTDALVAPVPPLPPVRDTDAAFALDANLRAAPVVNRAAIRAILLTLELAPLAVGAGARLRRLDPAARTAAVERLGAGPLAPLLKAVTTLAHMTYYGDPTVLKLLGYDADAVVARAARARALAGTGAPR